MIFAVLNPEKIRLIFESYLKNKKVDVFWDTVYVKCVFVFLVSVFVFMDLIYWDK